MFQQPAKGDQADMNDLIGSLVLFYVHEVRQGINTPYGEKEAIACDIHVLDGIKGGETFENALIFQGALIGSLRNAAGGEPVLGRVGQGLSKPGQKPPFILSDFTDADAAIATGYIQRMKPGFQAPATPTQPAASGARAAGVSPAGASPAPTNGTTVDISSLPPEVQALILAKSAS